MPLPLVYALRYLRSSNFRSSCRALKSIRGSHGMIVASGPFVGLKYVTEAVGSELAPKLVGSYEKELHPIIREALSLPHDLIIDIGAAEGYYAIGLATLTQTPVVAFESSNAGQRLVRRMAEINGVTNLLNVKGLCSPSELATVLNGRYCPLVFSDCEGAEFEILDLKRVASLVRADILVEVHGRVEIPAGSHPNHPTAMAAHLRDRFASTHEVIVIKKSQRQISDWPPSLIEVSPKDRLAAMQENRAEGSCWLWMTAKLRQQ